MNQNTQTTPPPPVKMNKSRAETVKDFLKENPNDGQCAGLCLKFGLLPALMTATDVAKRVGSATGLSQTVTTPTVGLPLLAVGMAAFWTMGRGVDSIIQATKDEQARTDAANSIANVVPHPHQS